MAVGVNNSNLPVQALTTIQLLRKGQMIGWLLSASRAQWVFIVHSKMKIGVSLRVRRVLYLLLAYRPTVILMYSRMIALWILDSYSEEQSHLINLFIEKKCFVIAFFIFISLQYPTLSPQSIKHHLHGLYKHWFLPAAISDKSKQSEQFTKRPIFLFCGSINPYILLPQKMW